MLWFALCLQMIIWVWMQGQNVSYSCWPSHFHVISLFEFESMIKVAPHEGHCQNFIAPCEKKYRVLLVQQSKNLYKFCNYYGLDKRTHTILYLKYGRWKVHVVFLVNKVGYVISGRTKNLCEVQWMYLDEMRNWLKLSSLEVGIGVWQTSRPLLVSST